MGLDTELTGVLRDVVQFLECLREAKLAANLECVRSNLLIRSKDALTMLVVDRLVRSSSPEPYLNMNAARSKGMVTTPKVDAELQEYVGAEEPRQEKQPQHHQDYYETLQTVESTSNVITINGTDRDQDEQTENTLLEVYANLSAAQAKSMCQMCGSLYRKEGKKLFVFEQYRAYWVGLIGSYLLIYGSDRDSRPCTILPIRGYMARAAPNAVPRDQRRSESTFEIFRPGNRTFQFVANTPKNMEQWIAKICELGSAERTEHKTLSKVVTNASVESDVTHSNGQGNPDRREERYQDVGSLGVDNVSEESPVVSNAIAEDNSKETDSLKDTETNVSSSPPSAISPVVSSSLSPPPPTPPPLPPSPLAHSNSSHARTPRKLPSLPVDRSSYEFLEEEEDDIYHKIEDFRDATRYGNVAEIRANARATREPATYDDVRANVKNESKSERKQRKKNSESTARKSLNLRNEATYDDTTNTVSKDKNVLLNEQESLVSYDDVENLASRSIKVRATDKTDESTKSPQKKSFLDRVRSKRESPKKTEKKVKCKTPTSPPPPRPASVIDQEPPTYYDDVSELTKTPESKRFEEEDSEYTCPPAPRPVYVKPPVIADTVNDSQEFYDDVSTYREKYEKERDRDTCQFDQRSPRKHSYGRDHASTDICENVEDDEHYKIPRVDAGHPKSILIESDELYDDIAILADFTARQKEYPSKKDNEEPTKLQASPEKRSWNRFVGGKKSKTIDIVSEPNNRASNGSEEVMDDFIEQQSSLRMNTFQKLISRMENSLGKASVRSASSILLNKTNVVNNA